MWVPKPVEKFYFNKVVTFESNPIPKQCSPLNTILRMTGSENR